MNKWIKSVLSDFFKFLPQKDENPKPKLLSFQSLALPITASISLLNSVGDALDKFASIPFNLARLIFSIIAMCCCIHVFTTKEEIFFSNTIIHDVKTRVVYQYAYFIRLIGKIVFIILLFVLPFQFSNSVRQAIPYSSKITGTIYDEEGRPIKNAIIRIITKDGIDITSDGEWISDDLGFFVIKASKTIYPSSQIIIISDCGNTRVALNRKFKTQEKYLGISNFRYNLRICND